jgi:cytochrome b pre-mRNA-processing protein 3
MLRWLKARSRSRRRAGEIYGVIVAQARMPAFYTSLGIPDTPVGRYETVVVHLFLVLEWLRSAGPEAIEPSRRVLEAFVADMDDYVRQYGSSDVATAKKVRRAAAGFYERAAEYRAGLGEPARLDRALAEHVLANGASSPRSAALAHYMQRAEALLSKQSSAALLDGQIEFPAPPATTEEP